MLFTVIAIWRTCEFRLDALCYFDGLNLHSVHECAELARARRFFVKSTLVHLA
jgi:hypothetical protein